MCCVLNVVDEHPAAPLEGVLDLEARLMSLAFDVLYLVHQHELFLLVFGIDKNFLIY